MNFKELIENPKLLAAIGALGYVDPTPIQTKAMPVVREGRDVVGLAQTGTGKTAAFMLPILERLKGPTGKSPRALVVAPTRELADQITAATLSFGKQLGIRCVSIYGGVSFNPQVDKLRNGVDIVVACPGRLLDHMQQRTVDLRSVEVLVLDEADHMFDMGFLPNVRKIVSALPTKRQTLLFSATMPPDIRLLADEILMTPVTVQVDRTRPADSVTHAIYQIDPSQKTPLLLSLLSKTDTDSVLIFTKTKHRTKRLAEQLSTKYKVASLQGNLSQNRRKDSIDGFRSGKYQIMVATDIAARGIDISSISHVINYDVPDTVEAYTHRIGRTGRALRKGDSFTFVTAEDGPMVRQIERSLGSPIPRLRAEGLAEAVAENRFETLPPPRMQRDRGGARGGARGGVRSGARGDARGGSWGGSQGARPPQQRTSSAPASRGASSGGSSAPYSSNPNSNSPNANSGNSRRADSGGSRGFGSRNGSSRRP